MLFCADGFIHVTLHQVSCTNLTLDMVETSKDFTVEVRDRATPGLGSVLI